LENGEVVISREEDKKFSGGFSIVRPVFTTPLYCIVGSSANPRYPLNTVFFWDDHQSQTIAEIHFRSEVRNVLIRRDKAVIVLSHCTYVYMLNSLKAVSCIETCENSKGAAAMSFDKDLFVLLTLAQDPGTVRVENGSNEEIKSVQMHENPISCLAIDFIGKIAASASEQGTIIRVFDTWTLEVLHELRRGTSPAQISSISFSPSGNILAVTSNKSTLHVWKLEKKEKSLGGMFSKYLPGYFQFSRSLGKLSLKSEIEWTCPFSEDFGPKCSFLNENELFVACLDGNLLKCVLDLASGSIHIKENKVFFDISTGSVLF
jgi:WD40 repeat protein